MITSQETIKKIKSEQKHLFIKCTLKFSFPVKEMFIGYAIFFVAVAVIAYIIAAPVAYWGVQSSSSLLKAAGAIGIIPAGAFLIIIFLFLIGSVFFKNTEGANSCITISFTILLCCLMLFGLFSLIAAIMLFVGISQEPRDMYNLAAAISAGVFFLLAGIFQCFGCGCWSLFMQCSD